jgi:hypothetical protein
MTGTSRRVSTTSTTTSTTRRLLPIATNKTPLLRGFFCRWLRRDVIVTGLRESGAVLPIAVSIAPLSISDAQYHYGVFKMSGKPRGPRSFRDRDIKRIVRVVADTTGKPIRSVSVDPKTGHCTVMVGESDDAIAPKTKGNELDQWTASRANQTQGHQ